MVDCPCVSMPMDACGYVTNRIHVSMFVVQEGVSGGFLLLVFFGDDFLYIRIVLFYYFCISELFCFGPIVLFIIAAHVVLL